MSYRFVLLIFYVLNCFKLSAQPKVPPLERLATLNVTDESISSILTTVASQTQVKFSYNPASIPAQQKANIQCTGKPVRYILSALFTNQVIYKQKSDFIILTPKPIVKTKVQKHVLISGYIYTAAGDKLTTATVLSEDKRIASVTNQYGYFQMNIAPEQLPIDLKIVKENFPDTIIHLTKENALLEVSLPAANSAPRDTSFIKKQLSETGKFFGELFVNTETQSTMRNLKDTLFTRVQFSLIPYVSTNKLLAGNTINDFSINLLAGYSQGIRKAEVGGLFNIDRGDVSYFQAAGLCNLVKGTTTGGQFAGIANFNSGKGKGIRAAGLINAGNHMEGIQLAGWFNISANSKHILQGLHNITNDTVTGIEVAGLANMNSGYFYGIRLGGLYNLGNSMRGIQAGGLFNTNIGTFEGIQTAGLFNVNRETSSGVQLAGLFNSNFSSAKHISVSGLANFNFDHTEGVQVSSILNYSHSVKGVQLALFNFSDTCDGIPIGLASFVRRGYHKIEVYGDEVLYTQLAFRTGVQRFHTIFMAGVDMTRRIDGLWSLGYGVGSYSPISEKWMQGIDATVQWMAQNANMLESTAALGAATYSVERIVTPHFSVAFGPSVKFFYAQQSLSNILVPYSIWSSSDGAYDMRVWVGGKLSFKFL